MKTPPQPSPLSEAALKKAVGPERHAEVLAHLLHFRDANPAEVVRRLGLTPELWAQADAFWCGELKLGVRRQQRDLALRFSTVLARTRARLAKTGAALSAIGTLDAPPSGVDAKPPVNDMAPPAAPAAQVLPSFMAVPTPMVATPMVATPVVAPIPMVAPTPMVAPVPMAAAAAAPAAPAAKPRTMAIPAVAAAPEERKVFVEAVDPQAAIKSAIEHAEAVQGPRPAKLPVMGLTEPTQADEIAAIALRLLPFGPGGAPSGAAPVQPPGHREDSPPALPLERHASLHVELTLHPEQRAEILQRYGLSPEQHAKLDAAWRARLERESSLRSAWDAACAQYRAWLLRAKPA